MYIVNEENQFEFKEEQLILTLMEHGYSDGSELKTTTWIKRRCLKPNGTLTKVIENAHCILEDLELKKDEDGEELTGRNRRYLSSGFREEFLERETNRKGTVRTRNQEIIKEYIFNCLLEMEFTPNHTNGYGLTKWSRIFDLFHENDIPEENIINLIRDLHKDVDEIYFKPKKGVNEFKKAVTSLRRGAVENAFIDLEREQRIEMTINLMAVGGEKGKEVFWKLEDEEYKNLIDARQTVVETMGSSMGEYFNNIGNSQPTRRMQEVFNAVSNHLSKEYNVNNFYKSYHVEIIDSEMQEKVFKHEMDRSYFAHLINLTVNRHKSKKYRTSTYFWRRFYLLNTFSILIYLSKDGNIDEDMLQEEKDNFNENYRRYKIDYSLWQDSTRAEEKAIALTTFAFGHSN